MFAFNWFSPGYGGKENMFYFLSENKNTQDINQINQLITLL